MTVDAPRVVELVADAVTAGCSTAAFDAASSLLELRLIERPEPTEQAAELRTPEGGESFLLVLSGTHDLFAGGGSWVRRGLRRSPYDPAPPVGIFLPPNTPFRLENGSGHALLLAARQPELPVADSPKDALSKKPLLPMAGSGKAFDPATGTWKPKEAFLSSPEAILPRRIKNIENLGDDVLARRILDVDYKALGLCVDEYILPTGADVTPPEHEVRQEPRETALYFETEGRLIVDGCEVSGRGALRCRDGALPALVAAEGRAYVALLYAGPKPTT